MVAFTWPVACAKPRSNLIPFSCARTGGLDRALLRAVLLAVDACLLPAAVSLRAVEVLAARLPDLEPALAGSMLLSMLLPKAPTGPYKVVAPKAASADSEAVPSAGGEGAELQGTQERVWLQQQACEVVIRGIARYAPARVVLGLLAPQVQAQAEGSVSAAGAGGGSSGSSSSQGAGKQAWAAGHLTLRQLYGLVRLGALAASEPAQATGSNSNAVDASGCKLMGLLPRLAAHFCVAAAQGEEQGCGWRLQDAVRCSEQLLAAQPEFALPVLQACAEQVQGLVVSLSQGKQVDASQQAAAHARTRASVHALLALAHALLRMQPARQVLVSSQGAAAAAKGALVAVGSALSQLPPQVMSDTALAGEASRLEVLARDVLG